MAFNLLMIKLESHWQDAFCKFYTVIYENSINTFT
jgi:hypothetical protein